MSVRYRALRGTRDILPDEAARWQYVEAAARERFERYGFREIRTPVLETTELFVRSVGGSTDIVRKEMYTLQAGDESITLRPENTAPVVRSFVENSLHRTVAAGYPERVYYIGPMFRHERPQKGRQRQFHQIGVEVLGAAEPLADAETLEMLWGFLADVGVPGPRLLLNSVGDPACRATYRDVLRAFLEPHLPSLCEDCRRRYEENPLRVFDCKVEHDRHLVAGAPTLVEHLCGPCREHLDAVRGHLDAFGIPYEVDPRMVRGLDYYVRTVFEVTAPGLGAQSALLGGGRYDGLVEELGGPAIPGFGFALGVERLLLAVPADRGRPRGPDLAVITLGPAAWARGVSLVRELRARGLRVLAPVSERPMGAQFKRAERAGTRFALYVGEDDVAGNTFHLKDLAAGTEQALGLDAIVRTVRGADGA